jgi:hypothetical protein
MYSYEERIRAVKLYIKLGGRLCATIRKLGYWHNDSPDSGSGMAGTTASTGHV